MKKELYIALGIGAAIAGFAAYLLTRKRKSQGPAVPLHKNERLHLTPVFSKAKRRMLGEEQ